MTQTTQAFPFLGFGLGLRAEHYDSILSTEPTVDWFEIIAENYLVPGGKPRHYLRVVAEKYPLVVHGVSLSIGSVSPLDWDYLKALKQLADDIQPVWMSDHLCWTGAHGVNLHDLMPLPYTEEAIKHVSDRMRVVQDYLERPLLLENVSSYVTFTTSEMTEWEFVCAVLEESRAHMLLDVNNVYVNSCNHGFDPHQYIDALPGPRVQQIHLAGHTKSNHVLVDTHDQEVKDDVWQLYSYTVENMGLKSTMIERDGNIPPLEDLVRELAKARAFAERVASMAGAA